MNQQPVSADAVGFFPQWQSPQQSGGFWFRDIMHNPLPITPMNASFMQPAFSRGASRAIAQLSMPITNLQASTHHGYVYLTAAPFEGSPDAVAARFEEMKRLTMVLGATVLQDWRAIFEPRILEMAATILSFDYGASSTRAVAQFILTFDEMMTEVWDIHMRVNIPPMNAVFGFEELLGGILGPDSLSDGRRLLQGFGNKSLEMGHALWDLARWVRAQDGLAETLSLARVRGGRLELLPSPHAGEFERRWQAYLETYGWRSDIFFEIGHKSWREDPSSPLMQLKAFIALSDAESPYAKHDSQVHDRERLEKELAERLPGEVRPIFHALLPLIQQYVPIAEDHNFTIDQKFVVVTRHGFLQLGHKLVADGQIRDAEDVFFLLFDEIRALAEDSAPADFKRAVRERQQVRLAQGKLNPPSWLGTQPPADLPPDPLITKFFGLGVAPSTDRKIVTGNPCSAGTATGTARVIMSLDQAHRLQPGDILVCQMTMPAWTPLFGHVSAVVADSGGPLSHCAIVAREYGIPCVAGTIVGTGTIPDGARIRVDGASGMVHILDEARE